jgi:hypothetical protein
MKLFKKIVIYPFIFLILLFAIRITACSTIIITPNHIMISDTLRIKKDLDSIIKTDGYRNYKNLNALNQVANYIKRQFQAISDSTNEQNFIVDNNQYKNIICSINTNKKERIIVGAHYDVCGDQDGADDNASGVAGLLELARLLKNEKLDYRIDFVAYSLEEPPYFGTDSMGSFIHAKYLFDNKIPIKGMICLEMIGYFSDKPNSQDYPLGILNWFYGDKADYILIVQKFWNGDFGDDIKNLMQKENIIATKSLKSPKFITGVDFSDHRNYWKFDYSAIMITNTSFYRNKNYHENTDKIETLDIKRLALTIDELYLALKQYK